MHQSFTWAADTRLFYGTNGGDREATGVPAAFQFTQKLMRKSQAGQTQSVQLCLKVHILFLTQIKVSRIVAKTFFSLRMALPSIRMCKLLIWLLQILLKSFVVSVLCFSHCFGMEVNYTVTYACSLTGETIEKTLMVRDSIRCRLGDKKLQKRTLEKHATGLRGPITPDAQRVLMNPKRWRLHSPGGQVYDLYLIEERMRYIMRTYTFMSNTKSFFFQT